MASGAGAASKAAAGHGTPAVAQRAEGFKEEILKRTISEVQPDAWNPGEARIGIQAPTAQESDRGFPLCDAPLRRRPNRAVLFREDFLVHG